MKLMKYYLECILWKKCIPNIPLTLNFILYTNIWRGCYDVWETEQDKLDAVSIPLARLKECEELGLISKTNTKKTHCSKEFNFEFYALTETGKIKLIEAQKE